MWGGPPQGRSWSVLTIFDSKVEKSTSFSVPQGEKYDFVMLYVLECCKSKMKIFDFPSLIHIKINKIEKCILDDYLLCYLTL